MALDGDGLDAAAAAAVGGNAFAPARLVAALPLMPRCDLAVILRGAAAAGDDHALSLATALHCCGADSVQRRRRNPLL